MLVEYLDFCEKNPVRNMHYRINEEHLVKRFVKYVQACAANARQNLIKNHPQIKKLKEQFGKLEREDLENILDKNMNSSQKGLLFDVLKTINWNRECSIYLTDLLFNFSYKDGLGIKVRYIKDISPESKTHVQNQIGKILL